MSRLPTVLAVLALGACAVDPNDPAHDVEPADDEIVTEEGRTGYAVFDTPSGRRRLAYTVHDGRAIHQGDIDLGPVEKLRERGIGSLGVRWPLGHVPWTMLLFQDPAKPPALTALFAELETQLGIDFEFVPFGQYDDDDNIIIVWENPALPPQVGGQSALGMAGGNQLLSLSPSLSLTDLRTITIHETMHALGVEHEQQRPDRDTFINFHASCVIPTEEYLSQFKIDEEGTPTGPYDYFTTMHYAAWDMCMPALQFPFACACPPITSAAPNVADADIGSETELTEEDVNTIWQMYATFHDVNEASERFGHALAVGDFDADGYEDLAVGIPSQTVGSAVNAGAVLVYRGTASGPVQWHRLTEHHMANHAPAQHERFGTALAAGDFDGDGFDDLAIGAPGESSDAGAVFVFRGTAQQGLVDDRVLVQEEGGAGTSLSGDMFGAALAMGSLTGKTTGGHQLDSLAVGAPFDRVVPASGGTAIAGGAVYIYTMVPSGRTKVVAKPTRLTRQNGSPGVGHEFGGALAIGFLDTGDGRVDLAIGAPGGSFVELHRGRLPLEADPTAWSSVTTFVATRTGFGGERYGHALAIGFFLSGRPTLAVGAPESSSSIGRIELFPGFGPSPTSIAGGGTKLDRFGSALAIGDVQGGAWGELFVGVPGFDTNRGKVRVYIDGATTSPKDLTQSSIFSLFDMESGDGFGNAIALGQLDGAERLSTASSGIRLLDVAIGAVGEKPDDPDGEPSSGAVYTLHGDSFAAPHVWHQLHQEFANVLMP